MTVTIKGALMDRTLARLASFFSLKISNIVIMLFLLASQIFFMWFKYYNFSPVYVLFATLISLFLIQIIMENSLKKPADDDSFTELKKKIGYTPTKYKVQSYTFLITVIIIIIWYYKIVSADISFEPSKQIPIIALIVYVSVRLIIWFFSYIAFRFFPMKFLK